VFPAFGLASLTMDAGPLKSKLPEKMPNTKAATWRSAAALVLPDKVVGYIRELRSLTRPEQRAHLGFVLHRLVSRERTLPEGTTRDSAVLFVCYGNIIRSALAEALYRRHATALWSAPVVVQSAGLEARPGREADARAVAAGRELGVDLASHKAQPLTPELVDGAHVIFVMDRLNEAKLLARFPSARSKLRRLGALAARGSSDIIPDPYVLDAAAVAAAARRIDAATEALATAISEMR
jgi:low molecular weight protein-tyrosine phosphatase